MTSARAAAGLLLIGAALLTSGCAALRGAPPARGDADADAPVAAARPAAAAALGVQVEIAAPAELKALLERHLDVVRLGRIARDEVDESEWARLIDASPAQVRELLQTEGYFRPEVTLERRPRSRPDEADRVRIAVAPGPRARISRVTMEAEGDLERQATAGDAYARATLEAWRRAWSLPAGDEFRNTTWNDAKAAAIARLRAAGYATAQWTGTAAEVDTQAGTVRLFVAADSGPLFRLGSFEIEGLVAHDADTVRHLAATPEGEPVTEAFLLDFQERLQKSGLFESINVTLDPDPAGAERARVAVRLREGPLQVWTFGIGVSANTGPRASVEHLYRRVFGFAATARNKLEWGSKRQAWDGELSSHPGEGLYRNLLGGAIENLEGDDDTVLSQRVRLGRTQDTTRIERLYFVEAERSKRETALTSRETIALSLNYHGVWRNLDSIVLPTEGFSFAGQGGVGRSRGTDAVPGVFTRAYGRFTGYLPFGRAWYGQARLEVGQIFLDQGVVAPESQRFRAGGDESVRGYGYRSLGPLVDGVVGGGNVILTSSVELARPITDRLPSVWGAVFADAGNAANSFAGMKLAVGYGVGIRWRSPVGPLKLDWAYGRDVRRSRLHFSVGIAF